MAPAGAALAARCPSDRAAAAPCIGGRALDGAFAGDAPALRAPCPWTLVACGEAGSPGRGAWSFESCPRSAARDHSLPRRPAFHASAPGPRRGESQRGDIAHVPDRGAGRRAARFPAAARDRKSVPGRDPVAHSRAANARFSDVAQIRSGTGRAAVPARAGSAPGIRAAASSAALAHPPARRGHGHSPACAGDPALHGRAPLHASRGTKGESDRHAALLRVARAPDRIRDLAPARHGRAARARSRCAAVGIARIAGARGLNAHGAGSAHGT